jgi:hypothetical protein
MLLLVVPILLCKFILVHGVMVLGVMELHPFPFVQGSMFCGCYNVNILDPPSQHDGLQVGTLCMYICMYQTMIGILRTDIHILSLHTHVGSFKTYGVVR